MPDVAESRDALRFSPGPADGLTPVTLSPDVPAGCRCRAPSATSVLPSRAVSGPARKPAAAFERGLTASQRWSSCSTSRPGVGRGEYVTYWPKAARRCRNWRTSS